MVVSDLWWGLSNDLFDIPTGVPLHARPRPEVALEAWQDCNVSIEKGRRRKVDVHKRHKRCHASEICLLDASF